MSDVRAVQVKATADTTDLEQGMNRAQESVRGVGNSASGTQRGVNRSSQKMSGALSKVSKAAKLAAGGAAAAGAAYAANLVKQGLEAADAQAEMAQQLGMTNKELATLSRAAEISGISSQNLASNMERLNRRLGDAADGGGQAADALEKLNLTSSDLEDLSPEEQIQVLGEALSGVSSQAERASVASDLFGRSGQRMLLLLENSEEAMSRASDEVETFGLALNETDTDIIGEATTNLDSLGQISRGVAMELAASFAPAIRDVTDGLLSWVKRIRENNRETRKMQRLWRAVQEIDVDDKDKDLDQVRQEMDVVNSRLGMLRDNLSEWQERLRSADNDRARQIFEAAANEAEAAIAVEEERRAGLEEHFLELKEQAEAEKEAAEARNEGNDASEKAAELEDERAHAIQVARDLAAEGAIDEEEALERVISSNEDYIESMADIGMLANQNAQQVLKSLDGQREAYKELTSTQEEETGKQKEVDRSRIEELQEGVRRVRESLMSETETIRAEYERRQQMLQDAQEKQLISKREEAEMSLQLERQKQDELTDIARQGWQSRLRFANQVGSQIVGNLVSAYGDMARASADSEREMFEARQKAARASAIVSTAEGIARAWATHGANPALAAAISATVAAAGAAQLHAINSQSFEGGGSAPSGGGGGGGGDTSGSGREERTQRTLIVQGMSPDQLYTGDTVRRIMDEIAEAQQDGYQVVT